MSRSPLNPGRGYRKLTLDRDTVWRYRLLATHMRFSVGDAIDLALREALERRGLPEEPNDPVDDSRRDAPVEYAAP